MLQCVVDNRYSQKNEYICYMYIYICVCVHNFSYHIIPTCPTMGSFEGHPSECFISFHIVFRPLIPRLKAVVQKYRGVTDEDKLFFAQGGRKLNRKGWTTLPLGQQTVCELEG